MPQPFLRALLMLALASAPARAEPPLRALEWAAGQVRVDVDLVNDNLLFGLLQLAGGRDGDDFGYTYGTGLTVRTVWRGVQLEARATSDLYTRRLGTLRNTVDDRGTFTRQNFLPHDRFELALGQLPGWSGLGWRTAIGWERLDSLRTGGISAAAQQQLWHGIVNDINPLRVINPLAVPDGEPTRDGAFVEARMSLRHTWRAAGGVAVRVSSDLGLHLGSITVYGEVAGRAELLVQRHRDAAAFRLSTSLQARLHAQGAEVRPAGEILVGHRLLALALAFSVPLGELWQAPRYHEPNPRTGSAEALMTARLLVGFPTGPR